MRTIEYPVSYYQDKPNIITMIDKEEDKKSRKKEEHTKGIPRSKRNVRFSCVY